MNSSFEVQFAGIIRGDEGVLVEACGKGIGIQEQVKYTRTSCVVGRPVDVEKGAV